MTTREPTRDARNPESIWEASGRLDDARAKLSDALVRVFPRMSNEARHVLWDALDALAYAHADAFHASDCIDHLD